MLTVFLADVGDVLPSGVVLTRPVKSSVLVNSDPHWD